MLKIEASFWTGKIKETKNGKEFMYLCHSEKDQEGNYQKSYFKLWLTDKTLKLFGTINFRNESKLIKLEGYLKVEINGQYTNMTIFPATIELFQTQQQQNTPQNEESGEEDLPF